MSDGRGGVDGARQRFEPERSWTDNTNLDKVRPEQLFLVCAGDQDNDDDGILYTAQARALLQATKLWHGPGLSWGDLFVLAGNAAILSMGGQVLLPSCFLVGSKLIHCRFSGSAGAAWTRWTGRRASSWGPPPCRRSWRPARASGCRWAGVSRHHTRDNCGLQNGECELPLGATTVGLIYVNPEGHMADGDPEQSARDIREVFARWGVKTNVRIFSSSSRNADPSTIF